MATRLAPSDTARLISQKTGMSEQQIRTFLQAQAELALQHARDGYPIAGLGILRVTDIPSKTGKIPFGPNKGKEIQLKAFQKLQLHIPPTVKENFFNPPAAPIDIFNLDMASELEASDDSFVSHAVRQMGIRKAGEES